MNMKETPLALTLDFGTQSVRASLIDNKGNTVAMIKKAYDPVYISKEKGYAEQDPDLYWNFAVECMKEIAANNKEHLQKRVDRS